MSYIGINPRKNIYPFIEARPKDSYPESVKKEIMLLSFNKNGLAIPFGSYIYRIQKYPGDIDLMETYVDCCDIEDIASRFAKSVQDVVLKVIQKRTHYFSEFKTGLDKRYDLNIGELINDTYLPNLDLLKQSEKMYRQKLLSPAEIKILRFLLKDNQRALDSDDYDVVNDIFREHKILRWSADEILNGVKRLPGNKQITLPQALTHKTSIKIDMITPINGRLIEVTNFLILGIMDEGEIKSYNIDADIEYSEEEKEYQVHQNVERDLPMEINKLYFSNMYYNPFKLVKRLFALSRHNKDEDILQRVIPFISSNISLLYQIKSEIDTIILVLERVKTPPKKTIETQLDEMKNRVASIIEIDDSELEVFNEYIDIINKKKSNKDKIKFLKELKKLIVPIINYETINYLNKVGLNPPPSNYLPREIGYAYITRTPEYTPLNLLIKIKNEMGNKGENIFAAGCENCEYESI